MEFPTLGQHCYQSHCKQLDFLPMKCDACSQIFCNDHIHYNTHSCTESYKKDNQVPVCPLCNKPVPVKKGEVPDTVVGRHIDNDCQSDPARERRKVYTNRCSMKGCKVKEIVPVKCDRCHKNYCLRHRFEDDHQCQGFEGTGQNMPHHGAAAVSRQQNSKPANTNKPKTSKTTAAPQQRNQMANIGRDLNRERQQRQQQQQPGRQITDVRAAQAGLSEEEAMARAIQQSLSETQQAKPANSGQNLTQEEEDMLLAQALAASEEETRRQSQRQRLNGQQQQQQPENKKSCQIS